MYKSNSLTPELLKIIEHKGTEYPGTGSLNNNDEPGTYLCRKCGLGLYQADSKFHSGCGWPSFDNEIDNNIKKEPDSDGRRTEILCNRCNAHLGHVFYGEGFTPLSTRHCVNSASLDFVPFENILDTEEAIFAGGCFWGVEYYLKKLDGVLKVESGYTGGELDNPSYDDICHKNTGHFEAVRVIFDPTKTNYEELTKYFFEIHDPTQTNGQGPDIGEQYLSAIFYYDNKQLKIAEKLIEELKNNSFEVVTLLLPVSIFWPAEEYHQDYYGKNGNAPYCHSYQKRFN